jgi:hypothetical protein
MTRFLRGSYTEHQVLSGCLAGVETKQKEATLKTYTTLMKPGVHFPTTGTAQALESSVSSLPLALDEHHQCLPPVAIQSASLA